MPSPGIVAFEDLPGGSAHSPEDFLDSGKVGAPWSDWIWQQQNAFRRFDVLRSLVPWLETGAEETARHFNLLVTPYYLGLIDRRDPRDPLAQIVIPSRRELAWQPEELNDPIGDRVQTDEMHNSPTRAIVHRYPDRCLLFLTVTCASYCRYCFRREIVSKPESAFPNDLIEQSLAYIRSTTELREVILSGGDPLSVGDRKLQQVLRQLDEIPHLRSLRIHTRFPVFNPFRVTSNLCSVLGGLKKKLWLVVHVTHPREITPEFKEAMGMLLRAGVPLLNQAVLVKGVNDDLETLKELSYGLADCGVKPHYLHYMDLAQGTSHFRIGLRRARELMRGLRGHLSGHLIPELILDIPSGYGKIRIEESFIHEIREENGRTVLFVDSPHLPGKRLRYEEVLVE